MAIMFLGTLAVFLGTGLWTLYAAGVPAGVQDLRQTAYPVALLLILTALGLLRRQNWSRAGAIGASLWLLVSSSSLIYPWPEKFSAFNFLRALPAHLFFEPRAICALVFASFALLTLKLCYSIFLSEAFMQLPPAPWKSLAAFVLFGAAINADFGTATRMKRLHVAGAAPMAAGKSAPTKEIPTTSVAKLAVFGERKGVKACQISLDETRLLLVTADGRGHQVDLRTGKKVEYPSQIDGREWPEGFAIGPDADMYFDPNRNMILKFSDPKFKYGIGGGANQFVSFTSSPDQIIVYRRSAGELKRIEIPLGTNIWSLKTAADFRGPVVRAFTSPDYVWMVLALGQKGSVIHLREGRNVQSVALSKELTPVQFGTRWMRVPGDEGGSALYSLPDMRRRDDSRMKVPGLLFFDDESGVSVLKEGSILFNAGESVKLSAPPIAAAVLNPPRQMVVLEEGLPQLRMVSLDNRESTALGKSYDTVFSREDTCFAVSSTRSLFVVSHGTEAEVFWSAFVGAGNFRSLQVQLSAK